MISIFYGAIFGASLVCTAIYVYMWHRHFDVNFTMIFTIVPVACMGHFLLSLSQNLGEALVATKVTYIGGLFCQLFILLSIFDLCHIEIKKWIRTLLFVVCAAIYASVLSIGYASFYYRSVSFAVVEGMPTLIKEYGPVHTVFYVVVALFFVAGIIAIIYSLIRKKQVPRSVIYLLVTPDIICMLTFFVGRRIISYMDFIPLGYLIAEVMYILIAYRVNLYNVNDTVIDSYEREQSMAYLSFDFHYRYLGSNELAKRIIPGLADKRVDAILGTHKPESTIRKFLDEFREDPSNTEYLYILHAEDGNEENDRYYKVNVNYLYDGNHKRGYVVVMTDDTMNRKYIRLIGNYNDDLKQEVEEKTRHIVQMHDNLIMSLAMMVESRDNSTGGHIRRTSAGVRILLEEVRREGKLPLTEEFCRDVIKAAPMHDLGKIAVDDAILRKPGRFTEEEFAKMKCHAAEGARVIHEILANTEDESFKVVAENVAHYHHERWDGSGYPKGLVGEAIPLEARIMAIADVYDALVSKRVYKEAYDFAKADQIICEGMGTQFDPQLRAAYEKARPALEDYYRANAY